MAKQKKLVKKYNPSKGFLDNIGNEVGAFFTRNIDNPLMRAMPILGSAYAIGDALKDSSTMNVNNAALSVLGDIGLLGFLPGLNKHNKYLKYLSLAKVPSTILGTMNGNDVKERANANLWNLYLTAVQKTPLNITNLSGVDFGNLLNGGYYADAINMLKYINNGGLLYALE